MIFNAGGTIPNETSLLWTNENPESNFPAQTINVDTSKYRMFFIVTAYSINSGFTFVNVIVNTGDVSTRELTQVISTMVNDHRVHRNVTINDSGITFSGNYTNLGTYSETYTIPLYIYGS